MKRYTHSEICRMYDNNPNMTLLQLSRKIGIPIRVLKEILMGNNI
jgi:hypothetical protein